MRDFQRAVLLIVDSGIPVFRDSLRRVMFTSMLPFARKRNLSSSVLAVSTVHRCNPRGPRSPLLQDGPSPFSVRISRELQSTFSATAACCQCSCAAVSLRTSRSAFRADSSCSSALLMAERPPQTIRAVSAERGVASSLERSRRIPNWVCCP